jgi:hypothetical protein
MGAIRTERFPIPMRISNTRGTTKDRSTVPHLILLAFLLAQICDGVLTYVGVHTFGAAVEANPIVAWYIAVAGVGVGVILVKSLAIGCAMILHWRAYHGTLGVLTALYVAAALWPWTRLLAF